MAQGETTQKELSRVAVGVPQDISQVMGIQPAKTSKAGIPLTPEALPSSAFPTFDSLANAKATKTNDEGVADVDEDDDEFDQDGLQRQQQERDGASVEKAAAANGKGGVKIGFFLHTPFPSSEIYRILPVRREILLGVMQCDLIG
jgi:trehalose 6-phosphate synthase